MDGETRTVRMLTSIAGTTWAADNGDVVTVPVADAARLVEGGQAVYVRSEPEDLVDLAKKFHVGLITTDANIVRLAKAAHVKVHSK